jgi:hypothetical protein
LDIRHIVLGRMINARDQRAADRGQRQQQQAAAKVTGDAEIGRLNEEYPNQPPEGQGAVPVGSLAVDPGLWFTMVNVKPPQLMGLEIESTKRFHFGI